MFRAASFFGMSNEPAMDERKKNVAIAFFESNSDTAIYSKPLVVTRTTNREVDRVIAGVTSSLLAMNKTKRNSFLLQQQDPVDRLNVYL